jgi:hypothetical protein
METPVEISLCAYPSELRRHRRYAQIKEPALTSRVLIGRAAATRADMASRRQARREALLVTSDQPPRDGLRA